MFGREESGARDKGREKLWDEAKGERQQSGDTETEKGDDREIGAVSGRKTPRKWREKRSSSYAKPPKKENNNKTIFSRNTEQWGREGEIEAETDKRHCLGEREGAKDTEAKTVIKSRGATLSCLCHHLLGDLNFTVALGMCQK